MSYKCTLPVPVLCYIENMPPCFAALIQILAPSDEAFEKLARALGAGHKLSKEQLFNLPELKEILQYHIVPGRYTTGVGMCRGCNEIRH